jgi:DNA replication regulator DPB11
MKVVTWEWFDQSRERGLALDEQYYHPSIPVEERGKGAWERRRSTPPTSNKRAREAAPLDVTNVLRRKLRRSASSRLGSQSEALWAGITSGGLERKQDKTDDWTESTLAQHQVQPVHAAATADTELTYAEPMPHEDPASRPRGPFVDEPDGIFAGSLVYPWAFDLHKVVCTSSDSSRMLTCAD